MRIRFAKQAAKDLEATAAFWKERWPGVRFTLADDVIALTDRLARGEFEGVRPNLAPHPILMDVEPIDGHPGTFQPTASFRVRGDLGVFTEGVKTSLPGNHEIATFMDA